MQQLPRIGIQICEMDPFWVQVSEVLWHRAQAFPAELVAVVIDRPDLLTRAEQHRVADQLASQRLDVLLCNLYPYGLLRRLLEYGVPIVYVEQSSIMHPRFTAREGLFDAAAMIGTLAHEHLAGRGTMLLVGGHIGYGDTGQSRIDGFLSALPADAHYQLHHLPTGWSYDDACARATAWLQNHPELQLDVLCGLSDSLALAAQQAWATTRATSHPPLVLGINGDPLALAAVADGRMTATVETDIDDIATHAVELAYNAARGAPLPPRFRHSQRLVTRSNVADVAARKLISLATLPTRLVEHTGHFETNHVVLIEPGLTVERAVAAPPGYASSLVQRAVTFMQHNYAAPLTRQAIADSVGVSKDYLGRMFHEELGFSIWEYLLRYRVMRARVLLRSTDMSIAEIAERVGFPDAAYFSRIFRQRTGCTPREFRTQ